jgi:hypothetical protein
LGRSIGVALVLALGACSGGVGDGAEEPGEGSDVSVIEQDDDVDDASAGEDRDGPDAEARDAEGSGAEEGSGSEEESVADDPYAIPEEGIDEAYVERVLEAIFEVNREALALTLEAEPGLVPVEAEERLRAIYGGEYGQLQYQALSEVAGDPDLRGEFRDPVGPVRSGVTRLLTASNDCIQVEAVDDFSEVLVEPPTLSSGFLSLSRKPGDRDIRGLNPTPWVVVDGSIDDETALSCS